MGNRVKRVIDGGGMALGGLTGTFAGPTIVEIIALSGLDAVLIDLEHNGLELRDVEAMVVAAAASDVTPIVRLPVVDEGLIGRLLDIGVQGIQVDGIESAEQAQVLVDAVRFPPLGSRGLIWNSRAARYGRVDRASFRETANAETLVKISIDSLPGIDAAAEIAAVAGVDIIGIGAHDMSNQLGVVGSPDHPLLNEAIDKVVSAVSATGPGRLALPLGSSAWPRSADDLRSLGCAYTNLQPHPEQRLLRSLADQASSVR